MNDRITAFLAERIDAGDFPSAVYLVAEKGEIVMQGALGHAVVEPERIEARVDTIYDLASLTKVLVTGLLAAKLVDSGAISTDDRVSDHLREFGCDDKRGATLSQLVTHTSSLPAWKPFYLCVSDPDEVLNEIARTPLNFEQHAVTYSDLNFITLGRLVERLSGRSLDALGSEQIIVPLGLHDSRFCPAETVKRRVAASEKGNEFEKQTCVELGYLDPAGRNPVGIIPGSDVFRTGQIWGEVHDGNAYFMGGVAGHAGLFSTAEEVFKIAEQFLPRSTTILHPGTCALFRTNFTPGMNEARSFAFQLAETPDSTAGAKMSPQSFGHLGFTGTSLWVDPVTERIFILLTNRTHDRDLPFANINSVRRRFHDLANEVLDKNH